jgi:hypothetical protein
MLLLSASCAPQHRPGPDESSGRPLDHVYNETRREGLRVGAEAIQRELTMQGTLGYLRPGVPVRTPPNVMAVWIPTFVNTEGDMVSGHWVYMVRQQEKWFIEDETGPGTAPVTVPRSSASPRRSAAVPLERPLGPAPTAGPVFSDPAAPPSFVPAVDARSWHPHVDGALTQPNTPPMLISPIPRVPVAAGGQP